MNLFCLFELVIEFEFCIWCNVNVLILIILVILKFKINY